MRGGPHNPALNPNRENPGELRLPAHRAGRAEVRSIQDHSGVDTARQGREKRQGTARRDRKQKTARLVLDSQTRGLIENLSLRGSVSQAPGSSRYCVTSAPKTTDRARQCVMAKPLFYRWLVHLLFYWAPERCSILFRAATPQSNTAMFKNKWVISLSHLMGMRTVERAVSIA